ncbi:MAG TPA: ATPase [Firmicutes bacterium]|jgi:MoxR-like ATPase|nr:ATPase [Bacillota bacterium]
MAENLAKINEAVKARSEFVVKIRSQIGKVIVGQEHLIDGLLLGLLANGHVLLEGVPGLAKTLAVKSLADSVKADFKRIQFTPDLLPSDLVGTLIYNPQSGNFTTKKGPIFAQIVLADEINRSPAKVQSALLEAMAERQVTIGDTTYPLDQPFMVLATQNPVEQQGTYPLPEAQLDRFMLKLKIGYPTKADELKIMERMAHTGKSGDIEPVITPEEILETRKVVDQVYMDPKVKEYIVDLVCATREPAKYNLDIAEYIQYGVSPRATINLTLAAKAYAFMQGRGYVTPNDLKMIGLEVLRHRIIITYEAEASEITAEDIVQRIFDGVAVP